MILSTVLVLAGCSASFPGPAPAERLQAQPPAGWQRVFELNNLETRLVDYVPEGESDIDWKARLSFESFAMRANADPIQILDNEVALDEKRCNFVQYFNLFSGIENNYATSVRMFLCGNVKTIQRGEVKIIKAIQGDHYLYVIRLVSRTEPFAANESDFSRDVIASWSAYLREITLCNPTTPDHPCTVTSPTDVK
jgi:hypothetical protein